MISTTRLQSRAMYLNVHRNFVTAMTSSSCKVGSQYATRKRGPKVIVAPYITGNWQDGFSRIYLTTGSSPNVESTRIDHFNGNFARNQSFAHHRITILNNALLQIEEHGWTEDAIAAAVIVSQLPISLTGLVLQKESELVAFFMDKSNNDLRMKLDHLSKEWEDAGFNIADRIRESIRLRLEMIAPFVTSNKWHEAMAIGAAPANVLSTSSQLKDMIDIVEDCGVRIRMTNIHKGAIGAVYVATELHMLRDKSIGFADTWSFLDNRVRELELLADNGGAALLSNDTAIAASAVWTSMGGAILSVLYPTIGNEQFCSVSAFVKILMVAKYLFSKT